MIFYIGDISKADAEVLKMLAENSNSALEFGCGASTQVIAHYYKGSFVTVDTEKVWIERTRKNMELLNIRDCTTFFYMYGEDKEGEYDFIFIDGLPELRLDFALKHWEHLEVGGVMAFHDTRRDYDFYLCCQLMTYKHAEIKSAAFNIDGSNITLIVKREPLLYKDWNKAEERKSWQYGHSEVDEEEFKKLLNEHNAANAGAD